MNKPKTGFNKMKVKEGVTAMMKVRHKYYNYKKENREWDGFRVYIKMIIMGSGLKDGGRWACERQQ